MTIRSKFVMDVVVMILLFGLLGAGSWIALRQIHNDFAELVDDTVPVLRTLDQVKVGGLRIVASTSEFGFILAEQAQLSQPFTETYADKDEEALIQAGGQFYSQAIERYGAFVARSSPDKLERLNRIRQTAHHLQATSQALMVLKREGRSGAEVLRFKEQFEGHERDFLGAVDEAIAYEVDVVTAHTQAVHARLATSTVVMLLASGLALIIVLMRGLSLERTIVTPLEHLTEAAEAFGRGQLATRIAILSHDELGRLATAFNHMGEELTRIDSERKQAEDALRDSHHNLERQVEVRTAALQRTNAQLQTALAERMQAEAALRESEALHRTTLSNISDTVFITDDTGVFTFVCPHVDIIFGYADYEVRHLGTIAQLLGDVLCTSADLDAMGEIYNIERNITDKSGHPHVLLVNVKRVSIRTGTRLYICRDITERHRTEARNARLGRIIEESLNEIFVYDAETLRYTYVNRRGRGNSGFSMEELETISCAALVPGWTWEDLEATLQPLRDGTTEHLSFETVHQRKDGSQYDVAVRMQYLSSEESPVFVASVQDITERKQAQEALQQQRDFANSLIEMAPVIILLMDPEGRIVHMNPYMEELSGYRFAEVKDHEWFSTFLPERDWQTIRAVFQQGIQTSQTCTNVHPIVTKDKRERLIEWHSKTAFDANGMITSRLAIGLDITERQQAEEALRQADRLAAIGEVVASVAHGIRNPLANIRAAAQVTMLDCPEEEGAALIARNLHKIMGEVDRMDGRLLELLRFVRPTERQSQPVDLNAALQGALHLLDGRLQREAVQIEMRLAPDLPPIMAEALVLEEVFLTLIANAIDAVYDRAGTITLTTGMAPDTSGGHWIFAEIRDTGAGVPADQMARIFEPFYTTKSRGTGLGLAIAKKFTEAYDGIITVESQPGAGSCFRVTFLGRQES